MNKKVLLIGMGVFLLTGCGLDALLLSDPTPEQPFVDQSNILESGENCFSTTWASSIGLEVGTRGQVATQFGGLSLRDDAFGDAVAELDFLETFEIMDGPACWQLYPTSNTALVTESRQWKVRSESRELEGWINEYSRSILGISYNVIPLINGTTEIIAGSALSEPVQLSGLLESNGAAITEIILFEDYGYITVEFLPDDTASENCQPQSFLLTSRSILITQTTQNVTVYFSETGMWAFGQAIDALFVQPGETIIQTQWKLGANCLDLAYTITITPVVF